MKNCVSAFLLFFITLALSAQNPPAIPPALEGSWKGSLNTGSIELPLVVHIKKGKDGEMNALLDSPLQSAFGIDAGSVSTVGDSFLIIVKSIQGTLRFHFDSINDELQGTWLQASNRLPITLQRLPEGEQGMPDRPQEPDTPLPYLVKEVSFRNETAGISLSGTLTLPDSTGHFPAVVLVSGSGPQDRDESIFGHRPFYVLSDFLTRNGIAVLRYDDRGTGKSEGFYPPATTADLAEDARAAHAFLQQHPNVLKYCTGIVGHSEGGLIAPMLAGKDSTVDFIILIAAPSIRMDSLLILQSGLLSEKAGMSPELIALNRRLLQRVFSVLREAEDKGEDITFMRKAVDSVINELSRAEKDSLHLDDRSILRQIQFFISPWMRYVLTLDPEEVYSGLNVPTLAIYGEKDLQVPAAINARTLEDYLRESPLTDYRVLVFPGLNHLMQNAGSGLPAEYASIEETMAPAVMELISKWILLHCKK